MMRANLSRRLTAILLALLCCFSALPARAATYPFVAFTTASLRLRQGPSDTSATLLTIPTGDAVVVTGESGNYYIVLYEGTQGYALQSYLKSTGASAAGPVVTAPAATQNPAVSSAYMLLYSGSRGTQVQALQEALAELGFYTTSVDGVFGTGTKNAVISFQAMNGLSQTGTADGATQQLLYEGAPKNKNGKATTVKTVAPVTGATIGSGSRGAAVSALQTRLKELGYYKSTVDGICGSGTVSAIRAFQKKAGLTATGQADAATQTALNAATAPRADATATPRPTATPTPIPTNRPGATAAPTFPFTTYTLVSVNLRKGPSTGSTRLLTISKGAEISVLALADDFLQVSYNGKTGYIMAEFAVVPAQYLAGNSLAQDSQAQQNYANLQSGSTGKNVITLQTALKELGFYTGVADGNYGVSTLSAVKAFQKKNSIKQDGIASPEVQKLIFEGKPKNSRGTATNVKTLPNIANFPMELGDQGEAVSALQGMLRNLGFYTAAIGTTYDSATQRAVRAFQQKHDLYVDGKAGAKTLTLLNALAATPTPPPAFNPSVSSTPLPTNTPITALNVIVMQNGTRGLAVERLQKRLVELGYYACAADGIYDSDDIAAVREFQRKNGLKIDGIAGLETQLLLYSAAALPATSAALPAATATPAQPAVTAAPPNVMTTLRLGSSGDAVYTLQERLKSLGYYNSAIDGLFGTGTAQAVTLFQRASGLNADGVAGAQTLTRLYSEGNVVIATPTPAGSTTLPMTQLQLGDSGDAVRSMQQRLVALGYLALADGMFGPRTYNALVDFQKRNGLTRDGIAGTATLARLYSSAAVAAENGAVVTPTPTPNAGNTTFKAPDASEVRYANWYSEIRARAKLMPDVVVYDPTSGLHYNLHMFSFGKHVDCEPPTAEDTEIMYQVCGEDSWTPKYVWVIFSDGRVYIASTHSHGHEVDHTSGNNLTGHICVHFPRIMSEAEATGPYAVRHQKEILWGWEITQAAIQ